jgi:hypothetical protein
MTEGTDGADGRSDVEVTVREDGVEPMDAVGTYETGDGVVFYDSENPLAWVQSATTVHLEEMV